MEPDEVFAEVERRKKRARDLNIPDLLWDLVKSFRVCRHWVRDDRAFAANLNLPGVEWSDDEIRFSVGQASYLLSYRKGRVDEDRLDREDTQTTHGTVTLRVNDKRVFEIEVWETVVNGHFGPSFSDGAGDVLGFIEGQWVAEVADFSKYFNSRTQQAWKLKNAPREAQRAAELKKRFGL